MKNQYVIKFSRHDKGAKGGSFVRNSYDAAIFSMNLLGECGYKKVEIIEQH